MEYTMDSSTSLAALAAEARELKTKLETLWADEGVAQLHIFLDPEITDVLDEIQQLSQNFIGKVAQVADSVGDAMNIEM
jgi:hypothetical protein